MKFRPNTSMTSSNLKGLDHNLFSIFLRTFRLGALVVIFLLKYLFWMIKDEQNDSLPTYIHSVSRLIPSSKCVMCDGIWSGHFEGILLSSPEKKRHCCFDLTKSNLLLAKFGTIIYPTIQKHLGRGGNMHRAWASQLCFANCFKKL